MTESNSALSETHNLTGQLARLHTTILERLPGVSRIACTLYDSETDMLKTFINSTRKGHAIKGYEFPLARSLALSELAKANQCRVIDDISSHIVAGPEHSNWLLEQDYQSSFTVPMLAGSKFLGFIFIDASTKQYFSDTVQRDLLLYCQLIIYSISQAFAAVHVLLATAKAARDFAHLRDFETGMHLTRMAQLSRLIAKEVAEEFALSDEQIEHIYLFAPLHDIGKIGIPDRILLKPGRLDAEEMAIMREHVMKGVDIIQRVLEDYDLLHLEDSKIMLNLVAYHHEFMDGSGYPHGLKGDAIPIEARIVTVADIFDALTSRRPYKEAWSIADALEEVEKMACAGKLDSTCVAALKKLSSEVEYIVTHFIDVFD